MAYEIDFIGVKEEKKDADAIAFRWKDVNGNYHVGVYDGGFQAHGEELCTHLNKYYFANSEQKVINCVICSHSDKDHVSGIRKILEEFTVSALYMNRPWLYIDDVWDYVNDGRITKASLERRLREKYKLISDLETLAEEQGVEIHEIFQGDIIEESLYVLSPAKEFYLQMMIESEKTPLEMHVAEGNIFARYVGKMVHYVKDLIETWTDEKLREDVETSAENEMSVVLQGQMEEEDFLLTGDAGIRALDEAIEYAESINESIQNYSNFIQIPHHGSRHNVSPSILDRLVGEKVDEGEKIQKIAVASVAKDSDHPLQMVVNAFVRRGVDVYKTDGGTLNHSRKMPSRAGWAAMKNIEFDRNVEDWND